MTTKPSHKKSFQPMNVSQLIKILELTIKKDEQNKVVTFLCMLTAYTDNAQWNISFNAPSSTGKSYIPMEVAKLFPKEDVISLGYCSPQAFYHEQGIFDKDRKELIVDLSRKILMFLEQPHPELLGRLRALLSHDQQYIESRIADRSEKGGLKTKKSIMKGFPAVIFCTAGLKMDEQEATRFILLSPETGQDKIRSGVHAAIQRESNLNEYENYLGRMPDRNDLIDRIKAIRDENIKEIQISLPERIEELFLRGKEKLKPRHQRDAKRFTSIVKAFALLNLWWREREGSTVIATNEDIDMAWGIWRELSVSQELNLPPYVLGVYRDVILPAWRSRCSESNLYTPSNTGVSRKEIMTKYLEVYGRLLDQTQLGYQILPALETAGLITQEKDPLDGRQRLVVPVTEQPLAEDENNNTSGAGVKPKTENMSSAPEADIPF